jgi:hypothetical protein
MFYLYLAKNLTIDILAYWREHILETNHSIRLTSAEIAGLCTKFMSDSMVTCVNKHVLEKVEDTEIRDVFDFALNLSQSHMDKIKQIFTKEDFPIPYGFTDEDVNLKAPRLFSDAFWLMYINKMSIHAVTIIRLVKWNTKESLKILSKNILVALLVNI